MVRILVTFQDSITVTDDELHNISTNNSTKGATQLNPTKKNTAILNRVLNYEIFGYLTKVL